MSMPRLTAAAIAVLLIALLTGASLAEDAPPAIKRTPLQAIDFPEGYKTVTGLAEVAPGGASGLHTHPGIETGYVLEGELNLLIDGQPEKTLKAGDSYQIPAGVVHDAKAHGDKAMKVLGVYVVDKTKPLASPAP
jgi:quercetin dioxygenase-like cupin family protein